MKSKCDSNVVIDIEKLQDLLKDEMDHHPITHDSIAHSKLQSSICKVQQLHGTNNYYPLPVVVSIGPYHHGKDALKVMKIIKWNYLEYILKANGDRNLGDYIRMLQEMFPCIMSYYKEDITMESNELVKMFLLDGCFLLLAIYHGEDDNCNVPNKVDSNDHTNLSKNHFLIDDLILVENQLPFFIVEKIHELFTSHKENTATTLSIRAVVFVEKFLSNYPKSIREFERPKSFCHLLHLCHIYLSPNRNSYSCLAQLDPFRQPIQQWRQALQYQTAGVNFQKREFDNNNPHSLLEIIFSNCVLEIPYLQIDQSTIVLLRNLIALEQGCPQFGNDITSYIIFMSHLVTDAQDAAMLVSKGIIQHQFASDEELSNMFKELSQGIEFDFSGRFYLKNICHSMEEYYQAQMKWILGWLRRRCQVMRRWVWEY